MNKSELLTGDKVVFKNGQTAIVLHDFEIPCGGNDDVLVLNKIIFMRLSMYDNNLKHISDSEFDVIAITDDFTYEEDVLVENFLISKIFKKLGGC